MTHKPAVVRSYSDAFSAHIAQSRLESEGIKALVVDENLVTNDPLLSIAVGGVKVVVSEHDVEAAREILEDKVEVEESSCPSCGSSRVQKLHAGRRSAFLTLLFLGFPIGRTKHKFCCEDCQHTWRE